jgi:branched-chain amino acid transport system substrate-binding protein
MTISRKGKWRLVLIMSCMAICFLCTPAHAEEKVIKIGILGPMQFSPGEELWRSAQIAADEINTANGISVGGVKHRIDVIKKDSNENRSVVDAVGALEKLITVDKVDFVIGGTRTEAMMAMMEVMADYHKILMAGGAADPKICAKLSKDYGKYKYFFRPTLNAAYQLQSLFAVIDVIAREVRDELGIMTPKVALLFDKAGYADPLVELAKKRLAEMGMEVVGVWRPAFLATDVTSELMAIKAAGAQIIFQVNAGPAGVITARQWGELKIPAALVGINIEATSDTMWQASRGMCEYCVVNNMIGRAKITDKTIPFYDKYKNKFGQTPLIYSSIAYDNIYILKEAIERAGTLESEVMVTEVEKTDYRGASGRIVFTPKESKLPHDTKWGPEYMTYIAIQWRDGKKMVVWPDGKAPNPLISKDPKWLGLRYEGTIDYELPPWMVTYWKQKIEQG